MARILIDARALADERSGGVGRAARFWIKLQTSSVIARSVITTKQSTVDRHPLDFARGRDDNSKVDEVICVTTGLKPSAMVIEFCQENNLKYLHLRLPNKLWTFLCFCGLASLSKSAEKRIGKIDLILLPNLGFTGGLHRPYELLLHDLSFLLEPRWFTWRRRLWHKLVPIKQLIEKAERVDCVSNQTKRDALRLFALDPGRVSVIPPMTFGLPAGEAMRPAWLSDSIQRFALLLGGSDPRKNIQTALRAITTYNSRLTTSPLVPVVLGGRVCNHANRCHLSYLQAPLNVSDAEMRYLYQNASVLLYPSWYEGFGLPLHEAHQFKTPCIASTGGALPETAPPDTIFCHPAKPQEWLQALEFILAPTT